MGRSSSAPGRGGTFGLPKTGATSLLGLICVDAHAEPDAALSARCQVCHRDPFLQLGAAPQVSSLSQVTLSLQPDVAYPARGCAFAIHQVPPIQKGATSSASPRNSPYSQAPPFQPGTVLLTSESGAASSSAC